jgi:hypothetical protein
MFADLAAAKVRIETGDKAGAAAALESAIDTGAGPGLAKLAALRLARVLIDSGEQAKAAAVIDAHDDGGPFAADFAALRGDIAAAEGRWTRRAPPIKRPSTAAPAMRGCSSSSCKTCPRVMHLNQTHAMRRITKPSVESV